MKVSAAPSISNPIIAPPSPQPEKLACVSLIVPAFNEEHGIGRIIERALPTQRELAKLGMALEMLVVDDGSCDRTAQVVAGYRDVRLIRHARNCGYGAAIKTGFRHASGDYLAFIDADGNLPTRVASRPLPRSIGTGR
jgi:glycosyltransferase involved in cell wall biosynthesis